MAEYIDRQAVMAELEKEVELADDWKTAHEIANVVKYFPSADVVEVVRCKDCLYGYHYFDVRNGETDSWIECRNPDGLNRDVSEDGYCSASIRK